MSFASIIQKVAKKYHVSEQEVLQALHKYG